VAHWDKSEREKKKWYGKVPMGGGSVVQL